MITMIFLYMSQEAKRDWSQGRSQKEKNEWNNTVMKIWMK